MPQVVFVSHHYLLEKRQAGFQFLARTYADLNWEVIFITSPIALFSLFTEDYRFEYPIKKELNKKINVKNNLVSYIFFTLISPENINNYSIFKHQPILSKIINNILTVPYFFYGKKIPKNLKNLIRDSDLVIFESTPALMYFKSFQKVCPNTRFVYRVSDDLEYLNCHPSVIRYETKIASEFNLISVPSSFFLRKFSNLSNVRLHHHGLAMNLFEKDYEMPHTFQRFEKNIIFIGNSSLDGNFIKIGATLFPNWGFHLIGPFQNNWNMGNIMTYGELPFDETIPYLKFSDIGLQTRTVSKGFESLSDSLKVIQYTWMKLPIIAPIEMNSTRSHVFYYKQNDSSSIGEALVKAANYDRSKIDISGILSWKELAQVLANESQ